MKYPSISETEISDIGYGVMKAKVQTGATVLSIDTERCVMLDMGEKSSPE